MIQKILKGYGTAAQITNLLNQMDNKNQDEKGKKAAEIINNNVGLAVTAGLIPIPGADLAAVTGVQINMLRQLAELYDVQFMDNIGKNIITAIVGSGIARVGASLVKAIPGVGTLIGEVGMAAFSAASTYGLGKVFASHFAKGGTLENFDLKSAKKIYETEMKKGKEVIDEAPIPAQESSEDVITKIKNLAELHKAGALTDEEFQATKARLLAQI